jgi:hypothetical protein
MLGMGIGDRGPAPLNLIFIEDGDRWHLDFDPNQKKNAGKAFKACKATPVTVARTSETSWRVTGGPDAIGCLRLGGGGQSEFRGNYTMPFEMTVIVLK